jgi:Protein of unknown function (DUF3017)
MANRPVNTGSGGAAMPPPVHHDASPSAPSVPSAPAPAAAPSAPGAAPAGHRASRRRPSRASRAARPAAGEATAAGGLTWLPYLIVLAGVAIGMFVVWLGSKYAGPGTAIVGCSLLAGALFRLVLPARDTGLLSSRRKASDVLAFAAFGAAVLAVAIALP